MESWARTAEGKGINFACICVEDLRVAQMFGKLFTFTAASNWLLESSPGFGNLGCSGFSLISADWKFVTRKGASFLQEGEGAFRSFEKAFRRLALPAPQKKQRMAAGAAASSGESGYLYTPGATAMIEGLKSESARHLNGKLVTVGKFDTSSGRYTVTLLRPERGEATVAVRPCCLAPPPPTAAKEATTGVQSVGVRSMDAEHEACEGAFNELAAGGGAPALRRVHAACAAHFAHEEKLMRTHRFGGGEGEFSAFTSHVRDHARLLVDMTALLDHEDESKIAALLTASTVAGLSSAFEKHANTFDVLYAETIPSEAS